MEEEKTLAIAKELEEGSDVWHLKEKKLIYDALIEKFGCGVDEIIQQIVNERAMNKWKNVSNILGSNTLDDFIKYQFDPLPAVGFEFTSEKVDGEVRFCITKCPLYDLAKELGAEDLMFLMACETDESGVFGFNKNIVFKRTKTLMEGDDCCDHCYSVKKQV